MKDINTPLIKAYYEALNGVIPVPGGTGFVGVWEGEEPDDIQAPAYIVISDITSRDSSTQSSSDRSASIQIGIYTWQNKYGSALAANQIAGKVYDILKPDPNSVLSVDSMQMLNLRDINDQLQRVGELGGRKYINRIIVFQQDLFIFN